MEILFGAKTGILFSPLRMYLMAGFIKYIALQSSNRPGEEKVFGDNLKRSYG